MNCHETLAILDQYLDRELGAAQMAAIETHLRSCDSCGETAARRTALRQRLRTAARSMAATPGLETRIHSQILAQHKPARNHFWLLIPVAAALLLTAGAWNHWQDGGFRTTPEAQRAFIASLAPEVAATMRVGLQQHIHCSVYQEVPSQFPTLEELARGLNSQGQDARLAELLPEMQSHLPAKFRIVDAHRCTFDQRLYLHVAATDGKRIISLLITGREEGEAFESDLRGVAAQAAGLPIYVAGVRRFQLAGFETPKHLVYLVSDLPAAENLAALRAMASEMARTIRNTET